MNRTYILFLCVFLASLLVTFASATDSEQNPDCDISDTEQLSGMTWISTAPSGSPGEGLLEGVKALMKGIYTYSGGPDYLPTSYSNQSSQNTSYILHAIEESSVFWAPNQSDQLQWISEPDVNPKGWSGIVKFAGLSQDITPIHCNTDCSGFITSLFTYANTVTPTRFTSWMTKFEIPEAGCFDPDGACKQPNPLNYYQLITSGKNGWFKNVSLEELQPGDIITYADTKDHSESGHVMLVTAITSCPSGPESRYIVITDEIDEEHSFDTRQVKNVTPNEKTGAGIGMGIIRISNEQGKLKFYWNMTSSSPEIGEVALGRAL